VESEAREEMEATLAARRELGPGHDEQLIEGFLKRMESEIDRRVDDRVARTVPRVPRGRGRSALNPVTLAIFIPIIAVAGAQAQAAGVIAALAALVVIFLVSEFRR
jgi:hypothetical protein